MISKQASMSMFLKLLCVSDQFLNLKFYTFVLYFQKSIE